MAISHGNGHGYAGTLTSLEDALKEMTPERWGWHLELDEAKRTELEAYWDRVENEWTAYKINCGDLNFPQMKVGLDLYNKYAPAKDQLDWKGITGERAFVN